MLISIIKKSFLISSLTLISFLANAQNGIFSKQSQQYQYSSIGVGGGTSHYFGDLAPYRQFYYGLYTNVRWNGTINYTRQLNERLSGKFTFSYIRLLGDVNTYAERNLSNATLAKIYKSNLHFRNDVKEFTLSATYDLLPAFGKGPRGRRDITPYVGLGIGFFAHDPKARGVVNVDAAGIATRDTDEWYSLRDYATSGQGDANFPDAPKLYSKVQFVAPLSLGVKVKLNDDWFLGVEGTIHITTTDYLDDAGTATYGSFDGTAADAGSIKDVLTYRAAQQYNARTLENRNVNYNEVTGVSLTEPVAFTTQYNGGVVYNGNHARGFTALNDSYITTRFTLNYILPSKVKCPN